MMSSDPSLASLRALIAALLAVIPLQGRAQTADFALAGDAARVILKLRADSPMLRQEVVSGISPVAGRAKALGRRLGLAMNDGAAISERMQVVSARGLSSSELAQRLARERDE
jgi:serine protease